MKNKGYTLLELLGVIVILSVLITLVFPSVINFIKKGNDTKITITNDLIISAAEDYINDNSSHLYLTNGEEHCVSIDTLIRKNYLDNELIEEDLYTSKSIKVTYIDKYNYELVDSSNCKPVEIIKFLRNYIPVEYIESTGTQYIDTNFTPSGKLTVEGKISVSKPTREIAVAGTENFGWELGFSTTENRMFSYLNSINSLAVITTSSIWNTKLEFTAINDYDNSIRSLSVNVDNIYVSDTRLSKEYRQNLLLFNYRKVYYFAGKCYSMKFYDDDVLRRDFIPCYRKSDNVIGMYDLVEGKFYTNEGTGEFLKGEEVEI